MNRFRVSYRDTRRKQDCKWIVEAAADRADAVRQFKAHFGERAEDWPEDAILAESIGPVLMAAEGGAAAEEEPAEPAAAQTVAGAVQPEPSEVESVGAKPEPAAPAAPASASAAPAASDIDPTISVHSDIAPELKAHHDPTLKELGLGEKLVELLRANGVTTRSQVEAVDDLTELNGIGEAYAEDIQLAIEMYDEEHHGGKRG